MLEVLFEQPIREEVSRKQIGALFLQQREILYRMTKQKIPQWQESLSLLNNNNNQVGDKD